MNMEAVRALAQTVAMSTQGVVATVTVPGGAPVPTRGIWLQTTDEAMPVGRDLQRRDPRRLLKIPLNAGLPDVPRGSVIVAAPLGSTTARSWRVDNVDRKEGDQIRVVVAPVT